MKGFTLIETMIAITIVSIAVAGPLVTASRAIVAAETARDQLTASYLAQEAVEYIRSYRDDKFLAAHAAGGPTVSQDAWNNFIQDPAITACAVADVCNYDSNADQLHNTGPLPLYLGGSDPNYYYTTTVTGKVTPFTRTIQITNDPTNTHDELVVATVKWTFHGTVYRVSMSNHLTSWQ